MLTVCETKADGTVGLASSRGGDDKRVGMPGDAMLSVGDSFGASKGKDVDVQEAADKDGKRDTLLEVEGAAVDLYVACEVVSGEATGEEAVQVDMLTVTGGDGELEVADRVAARVSSEDPELVSVEGCMRVAVAVFRPGNPVVPIRFAYSSSIVAS